MATFIEVTVRGDSVLFNLDDITRIERAKDGVGACLGFWNNEWQVVDENYDAIRAMISGLILKNLTVSPK